MSKSRNILRQGAIAVAAGALLAAAAPLAAPANAESVLRVGASTDIANRGNAFKGAGTPSVFAWNALFDAMTFVNSSGEVTPRAALSWEASDPTTWVFKMRPNVTFSNGKPLNAGTVVSNIEFLQSEAGKGLYVGRESGSRGISSVRAIDNLTVEVKTAKPNVLIPARFSMLNLAEPGALADMGLDQFTQTPVGSGAFTLERWTPSTVMNKRTDSWRVAKVDKIDYIPLTEPASRLQALLSDQVDIAIEVGFDDIAAIRGAGLRAEFAPIGSVLALAMPNNVSPDSPLNDQRVRQAINYAVNKDSIVENLTGGAVKAAGQPGTPVTYGYNPNVKPYPYDPDKAKQLLAEAGFADGFSAKFAVVIGSFAASGDIYQQVSLDLKKVGVNLELESIQFPQWLNDYYFKNAWADGGYVGFSLAMNSVPYLDATRSMGYYSCQKNNPFFCDEDVAKLLEKQATLFDPDERLKAVQELAQVYHDLAPAIFLIERATVTGVGPNVVDFAQEGQAFAYTTISLKN